MNVNENRELLQSLIECAMACEACATACLNEEDVGMMARCIELDRIALIPVSILPGCCCGIQKSATVRLLFVKRYAGCVLRNAGSTTLNIASTVLKLASDALKLATHNAETCKYRANLNKMAGD